MYVITHIISLPYCLLICLLIGMSGCTHRSRLIKRDICVQSQSNQKRSIVQPEVCRDTQPTLTVWIHGTKFGLDSLFKKIFNATPDIKHVYELPENHRITLRMKSLANHCAEFFPYENVYCFCWSGKLNSIEREKTALLLHKTLLNLLDVYEKDNGFRPAIRLVCHSHGANVALKLSRFNEYQEKKLVIDSLILFACPVQCETKHCIHDEMFRRTYSLYSPLDWVQIAAPQWACRTYTKDGNVITSKKQWLPLSERRFDGAPTLRQAWIKRNNWALSHADFTSIRFLRLLPQLLDAMDEAYSSDPELVDCTKELVLHIKTAY